MINQRVLRYIIALTFLLGVGISQATPRLLQTYSTCGTQRGQFPLSAIDDVTYNGTVYYTIYNTCGDVWTITLERSATISIDLSGHNTDPDSSNALTDTVLGVYDASHIIQYENDDANGGYYSALYITLSAGTYYIVARGYDGATGGYSLSISVALDPPPPPIMIAPIVVVVPQQQNPPQEVEVNPPVQEPNMEQPAQPEQNEPAVEEHADLWFTDIQYTLNEDTKTVSITFTVTNTGNKMAVNFRVDSDAPSGWVNRRATMTLAENRSYSRTIRLTYPDSARGDTIEIPLIISNSDEWNTDDNTGWVTVNIPAPPQTTTNTSRTNSTTTNSNNTRVTAPESRTVITNTDVTGEDEGGFPSWLVIVAMLGGVSIGGAGLVRFVRLRAIKPNLSTRRYWQERATTEAPIAPCQAGRYWCKISKVEPQYERYHIEKITVLALPNLKDAPHDRYEIEGDAVKWLNDSLWMTNQQNGWEKIRWRMMDVARLVLADVAGRSAYTRGIYYFAVYADIEGSQVEFEFTLSCCNMGIWEEEASWSVPLSDKREVPIITLPNTLTTPQYEQVVAQLAGGLVEMIRNI